MGREGKISILETTHFEGYLIGLIGLLFLLSLLGFYNLILHKCFVSSENMVPVWL